MATDISTYLNKLNSDLAKAVYENIVIDIEPKRESDYAALAIKVSNAEREIKRVRQYPSSWTEDMIAEDMYNFYTNLYDLAMYDFNIRGAEGQIQVNENGESRTWVNRKTLLNGVTPIAVIA